MDYSLDEEEILMYKNMVYKPESEGPRKDILQEMHVSPYAIHSSYQKTISAIKKEYYWGGMKKIHSPASSLMNSWNPFSSLVNSRCARSLRDLTLGLPYGSHLPYSDQLLLTATALSSSSIPASWHLSFKHLFLHLYWLSLMSCLGNFSRIVSVYSNNLELCAQGHCNYNTSSYDNV